MDNYFKLINTLENINAIKAGLTIKSVKAPTPTTPEEAKALYDVYIEMLSFHQGQIAMIEFETLPKLRKMFE